MSNLFFFVINELFITGRNCWNLFYLFLPIKHVFFIFRLEILWKSLNSDLVNIKIFHWKFGIDIFHYNSVGEIWAHKSKTIFHGNSKRRVTFKCSGEQIISRNIWITSNSNNWFDTKDLMDVFSWVAMVKSVLDRWSW